MLCFQSRLLLQRSFRSCQVKHYAKSLVAEATVPLFGKLFLECKSGLRIRSLHPQQCPENDTIRVFGNMKPDIELDGSTVTVKMPPESQKTYEVEVPFQYEVFISQDGTGDTTVENVENKLIDINNRTKSIQMRNIKATVVKAVAEKNIHAAKHLQGNIQLKSISGNIMTDRIQGTTVDIQCPNGKVDLQAIYCDSCSIAGVNSNVRTGTTKGDISIAVEDSGQVEVGDVNGSLHIQMRSGNVKAHVSQKSVVDIDVAEGDIQLSVSPNTPLLFDLSGTDVEVDADLNIADGETMDLPDCRRYIGSLNGEKEVVCRLQTREGKVSVLQKDWYQTLSL